MESVPTDSHMRYAAVVSAGSASVLPVAAAAVAAPRTILVIDRTAEMPALGPFSDSAQLFGIGTLLFGLAAFVRRAA